MFSHHLLHHLKPNPTDVMPNTSALFSSSVIKCGQAHDGAIFKEWVKAWPSRSGTASIHPQIVPEKCFISEKKYIRALRYSIYQIISWIQKKRERKKIELLEDDSEPQLFKFYIHPERKYNINKDNTVQTR